MTSLFAFPFWGWLSLLAAAVAIPLLIHLINLLRYRRVRWAAMEFLLQSHKKRQKKVWLTQLLLILTRIGLLLVAILLFAQIGCRNDSNRTAAKGTIHLILLDDSYSMSERLAKADSDNAEMTTCLNNARSAINDLAKSLVEQTDQQLKLVKTSSATDWNLDEPWACDSDLQRKLEAVLSEKGASDTALGFASHLNQLASLDITEQPVKVYFVSDFREKDWTEPEIERQVNSMRESDVAFQFIDCGPEKADQQNLLISALEPENRIVSAGVPFFVNLEVYNPNDVPHENLQIQIRKGTYQKRDSADPGRESMDVQEEPTALLKQIGAKQKEQIRIPMIISEPGQHVIAASLPDDSLNVDNTFHRFIDVADVAKILIVSPPNRTDAKFIRWVFQPQTQGNVVNSGFRVDQFSASEAADRNFRLDKYHAVFYLCSDANEREFIGKLTSYVSSGGLAFILPGSRLGEVADVRRGSLLEENSDAVEDVRNSFNENMYRKGQGLVPMPIMTDIELSQRRNNMAGDLSIVYEPIKKYFEGDNSQLLGLVQIQRKLIPPRDWEPDESKVKILATVRGQSTTPLIVQKSIGDGNAITFLSPFVGGWNDWAKNPTFVVLIYRLLYHFSPFNVPQPFAGFEEKVGKSGLVEQSVQVRYRRDLQQPNQATNRTFPPESDIVFRLENRGIYEIQIGGQTTKLAVGLDLSESRLQKMDEQAFKAAFVRDEAEWLKWEQVAINVENKSRQFSRSSFLFMLLLVVVEGLLALKLGYHPKKRRRHA